MNNDIHKLEVDLSALLYKFVFIVAFACSLANVGMARATIEDIRDAGLDFDCDSLYYVQDDSDVYKVYGLISGVQTTLSSRKQYNLNVQSEYGGYSGRNPDTIALGPNEYGALTMYQWDYVKFSKEIEYVIKNQYSKIARAFSFPEFADFRGWSGGEINQKTGEIYFVGHNQDELGSKARIMIYDPATAIARVSGVIQPDSWETDFSKYQVESDMAIDADGNAYIMVSSGTDYRLLRVVPDKKHSNNWKYNQIQSFKMDRRAQIWGMAFLNGMLYVNLDFFIYELNPLTGSWRNTNFVADNSLDFTACQMAPIIKGKVYLDANGDGILSSAEKKADGVRGVEVQVYDSWGTYLGMQYTNGKGEYNFLLPSSKSTFYIRLKRPQVNELNAYQTWASGGNYAWNGGDNRGVNKVTPRCYNNTTIPKADYYEKSCYGAKSSGIDQSSNHINAANFYSTVVMQTDRAIVHANFALAPSDRSDAPYAFQEASHAINPNIYLGLGVDADVYSKTSQNANGDKYDDGVQVRLSDKTSWSNLQGFLFTNSLTYNFRVKVKSDGGQKGFLNAWVAIESAPFSSKIANNLQDNDNDGYIEFNYTMPERVVNNKDNSTKAFYRFRYSSANIANLLPANPSSGSFNGYPWAIDGEVEDYMSVYQYISKPKHLKGNFLIVNQNLNAKAGDSINTKSHEQTALYTQIAGKKFNVKLIHYDAGKISKDIGSNINATIDFVEYNTGAPNCNNVKMLKKNISSLKIKPTQTIIPLDVTLYDTTDKGTFKITYQASDSSTVNSTCSDLFVVRPKEFALSDGFKETLIGGKSNSGQIKALQNDGNTAKNYRQKAVNIIHVNSTLVKPSACLLDANASSEVTLTPSDIKDGAGDLALNYQNIGDIDIIISDNSWALNDKIYNDCLDTFTNEHDKNGKVGCAIAIKTMLKFKPKAFSGKLDVSDFANNYTYISSELLMHANISMQISALLEDDSTAVNYHENCFAKDVTYNMQLKDNDIVGWDKREGDGASKRITYLGKTGADVTDKGEGKIALKTAQNNFINGTADVRLGFNFKRPSAPERPFIVKFDDFSIDDLKDADNVKLGSYDGNGSAHMYYGRAHSKEPEYKVLNQNSTNAYIYYEVYCPLYCNRSLYSTVKISNIDMQYKDWYINDAHAVNQGNITSFKITQGSANISKSASDKTPKYYTDIIGGGIETLGVNKNSPQTPHTVAITINPQSWLLHDPSFKVIFLGDKSDWAGHGGVNKNDSVGRILDVNASKYTGQRIDW
ncbi:MAG: hypothetical protein LBT96_02535 [Campylobacteraceae bacterium]|jgi:hypothetical protein|nr:hypothetical protein [Campylobacteraceae bacterium]